jgi:DNA repair protein RecO (recombination protein O)
MSSHELAVTAFVVRRVTTGESDLVLSLLTREKGKLDVYARAGRKSRRRFQAGLSPCLLYQGLIAPSRRGSLWSLEEMIVARPAPVLTSRPSRMVVGQYATELVRQFCPPEVPEPELFARLDAFFVRLDQPQRPVWRDWFRFEWDVLSAAGLVPELTCCVACRRPGCGTGWGFSATAGGLLCPACGRGQTMPPWNPSWNAALPDLNDPSELAEPADLSELLALMEPWLLQVLNKKLYARGLCRSIFGSPTEW